MAEALVALGVAANIGSFIDFGCKILSEGYRLHKYRSSSKNEELESVALDLQKLHDELQRPKNEIYQSPTPNDIQLQRLAEKCREVCLELLTALEKLKTVDSPGKWRSFRVALKTVWGESKIQSLQARLDEARQELIVRILMSLREQLRGSMNKQTMVMDRITNLDLNTQGLGEKFLEHIQDSKRWKADLVRAIHQGKAPPDDRAQLDHGYISERRERMQRTLIDSLNFSEMTDRHNRIVEAHEKTFQWIFLPEGKSTLYWVTGKAGSGKSTLMKYLHRDKRTMNHLKKWAADDPLVTAAFFFWNSGTQMQMSEVGFLQSMLSQVLKEQPALIPRILPERWETFDLFGHDESIWSELELRRAFSLLAREEAPEAKFCFFIDGLDEFEGDHTNLITLIKDIGSSSNIKICISSRPWVLFEDEFKHKPSLMLQDLTYPDIVHFIDSAFYNKPEFVELEKREPKYASELLRDIAQKSAGVFLWVSLVVRSLLAGLVNRDRVSDLQRRLAFLPPDLENLYEKMLNSLDPFYLEHASQIFQHVRAAEEPPSLLCLSFADEEPEFVPQMKVQPLPEDERFSRADIMRRRLNSRCKGLLEVGPALSPVSEALDPGDVSLTHHPMSVNDRLAEGTSLADFTVQYLHRTVRDFLETPQVWDRILLAGPRTYDPYLALYRSFIAQLKCLDPGSSCTSAFQETVRKCMLYAYRIQGRLEEGQSAQSLVSLIDDIDRTATNFHEVSTKHPFWPSKILSEYYSSTHVMSTSLSPLALAVGYDLHTYVEAKVHQGYLARDNDGLVPLLAIAIMPSSDNFEQHFFVTALPSVKMVKMLLKHGADPNMVPLANKQSLHKLVSNKGIPTVWQLLLEKVQFKIFVSDETDKNRQPFDGGDILVPSVWCGRYRGFEPPHSRNAKGTPF